MLERIRKWRLQRRLEKLLRETGSPCYMATVFSGQVSLHDTSYDPRDAVLIALHDAIDAEFPRTKVRPPA